ncbi:outer membrane lipoprotein carrier protein LolA [Corallincola luteus]|uniref:Outer membrane lipoprotein carrier protein LolA n=1 Tax=Corallincola luteus TaxID=1775177 RepID=A0ABY2AM42_9GAMM|nr:outer membrane lipoprotein carrier protein LolA [Corallincola luteus]TCI03290.1 outer membrane lipoprotein carrier protein LolA [Corallincola luteus]
MIKVLFLISLVYLSLSVTHANELFSPENAVEDTSTLPNFGNADLVISAEYTQVRHIASMDAAIRSHGDFILAPELGLLWAQKKPFISRLWMDQEKMVQQIADASPIEINATQNPLPFSIGRIFFAIFRGDHSGLNDSFSAYLMHSDKDWQLGLIPRDPLISKALKQIIVTGNKKIRSIDITDIKGNRQELIFDNLNSSLQLTPQQKQRLIH